MVQRNFHLLLFPLFAFITAIFLFKYFSSADIGLLMEAEKVELRDHLNRYYDHSKMVIIGYFFAATVLALVATALASVAASLAVVWETRQGDRLFFRNFVLAVVVGSVLVFGFLAAYKNSATVITFLGKDVFALTVDPYWLGMGLSPNLASWIDITNLLGITGAISLALAIRVLAPDPIPALADGDDPETVYKQAAKDLAARTQRLKHLLFSASMILIAGVAVMQAYRSWPVPVLEALNKATAKAYLELADASIRYHGFMFVLVLIAMFLPMALWLQTNARQLAEAAVGCGLANTQDDWRKLNGLTLSFNDNLQRVVAVVSPLLAGPLLQLVEGGLKAIGGG